MASPTLRPALREGDPSTAFERRYGVRKSAVLALAWGGAGLLAVFALLLAWGPGHALAFEWLTDERGPVELSTFIGFMIAAVLAWRLSARARRENSRGGAALGYALFAGICLFAALEEISWGQSLFDFHGPAWLVNLNEQGETNLHDLPGLMDLNSAFVMAFGLAGCVATRLSRFGRWRDLAVPAAMAPLFMLIAGMGALETINDVALLGDRLASLIGTLSEAVEMLGAFGCVAYVLLNARMLERQWRGTHAVDAIGAESLTVPDQAAA